MPKNRHRYWANVWQESADRWLAMAKVRKNKGMNSLAISCMRQYHDSKRSAEWHRARG